jgi:NAD(P)-dependent dehydrogenase (short-subunit alcohol dehydrogenase family)
VTTDHHPGLSGKVAIVAGTHTGTILDVVGAFATNRMPVAVVAPDRAAMTTAESLFADSDIRVIAVTGDPSEPALWQRVAPHAEQRLGPIDVVVLAGDAAMRDLVVATVLPDMAARRRGVIIELGPELAERRMPTGVHHFLAMTADSAVGFAAAAAM